MRFKLVLFAVAWILAMALIVNDDGRVLETFQRANAALVCYWSDPGPPLAVPMPPDPQSINVKGSPQNAPLSYTPSAQRETLLPEYLKSVTSRPLRDIEITTSPTLLPIQTIDPNASLPSPFEEPSIPPTPVPTLGVLAVAPEVSATPRLLLTDDMTVAPTLATMMTTVPATFTPAPL
jgi:hypothetical protein